MTRLEDVGAVVKVQRQQRPVHVVAQGMGRFDDVDRLAADVAGLMKQHDEKFSSEEALQIWLTEAGIEWTEISLRQALEQLEFAGRLKRPRQDHWDESHL